MLETILKEINQNLERIANALELKQKIGLTVGELVGTNDAVIKTEKQSAETVSAVQSVENMPSTIQAGQVAPTAQIPTAQQGFTQEQLAVSMSRAVAAGKMNIIQDILHQFNVQALTQINPADYNKVATLLKEAGVEV